MSRSANSKGLVELLNIIEIVNFRVYILPKITNRADSKQAELFTLANTFFNNPIWISENCSEEDPEDDKKNIYEDLKKELHDFTINTCTMVNFVQALTLDFDEKDDFFHWNGLRYFLANYEEKEQMKHGSNWDIERILISRKDKNSLSNDYLSREHLWAKENRSSDFEQDYYEKRRLGNFVLIGLGDNSGLNNSDIPDKIEKLNDEKLYNKTALSLMQVFELNSILKNAEKFCQKRHKKKYKNYYKDLSTHINDERETELVDFALKRWRLPGEELNGFEKIDTFQAREEKSNINYYPNEYH
jgi:hypothetical protein